MILITLTRGCLRRRDGTEFHSRWTSRPGELTNLILETEYVLGIPAWLETKVEHV